MKALDVIGTSMWPVLKEGDTVLVDDSRPPHEGNLVARTIDGVIIVHRYLSHGLTKGDRFSEADPTWLSQKDAMIVIGVVPRKLKMSGNANLENQMNLGKLDKLQTQLSRWQLTAHSKFLKRLALAALIANGSLIRRNYYRSPRGNANVI